MGSINDLVAAWPVMHERFAGVLALWRHGPTTHPLKGSGVLGGPELRNNSPG